MYEAVNYTEIRTNFTGEILLPYSELTEIFSENAAINLPDYTASNS